MKREELKQKISVIVSNTTTNGNEKRDLILDLFNVSGSFICDHCDKGMSYMSEEVTICIKCYNKLLSNDR